jgi:hypothetical protein
MPTIGRLFYEIGGDTDRLQTDLRQAVEMAKNAGLDVKRAGQSFLASFNEALNPTGLLTEKLKLLEAAGKSSGDIIAVMGGQIRSAAETAKAHSQAIDPLVQKYADLANATKGGGFSMESLGKTITSFVQSPLSAAKEGITGLVAKLGPAAIGLTAMGSAAIAAGVAVFKLAESTAEEAEQITNLSLRTGIGVERVQSLQKAAELMGVSGETVVSAVSKINRELGKFGTGGEFTKGITSLGISLEDASGKSKTAIDLLGELRTKLLAIEDPAERAQVAAAVLGRRNQELAPLLLNAQENLFELAKQLEETGAVMDKVAIDQAMKLDQKLDVLSARFATVKTFAKEASVEIALAVSDLFTGDFWKLLAANIAKGAGMQSASLASTQMRIKEAADAAIEASKKQEDAGKTSADAAGLARMKEEELYNERLKLLSQGRENVDLLIKLQEAQEAFNTAIEKGLSHKEKEKALNSVLAIREEIKAREEATKGLSEWIEKIRELKPLDASSLVPSELLTKQIEQAKAQIDSLKEALAAPGEKSREELGWLQAQVTANEEKVARLTEQKLLLEHMAGQVAAITLADDKELAALGNTVAAREKILRQVTETEKTLHAVNKDMEEAAKIQAKIDRIAYDALVPSKKDVEAGLKKINEDVLKRLREYAAVEDAINKAATTSKLEQLRLQEQIVGTVVPMNKDQREQIEIEKIHLQFAIRAEETRVRFTQVRAELMEKINKLDPSDPLRSKALEDMSKLADAENEQLAILEKLEGAEVLKEHKKDIIAAAEEIRNQVSTVVNDFGKKVADSIVHWKSLGNAVKEFFTSLAESTLRIVMESLFKPLQSSIEKVVDSLFEKLFNPGSKKTTGSNLAPEADSWGNLLGTAGSGLPDWLKAATTPAEAGTSISGVLAAGNPLLQSYSPAAYASAQASPDFVGPTLDMVKGGIFGVGGTAGSLIQGGLMAGGTASFLDSFSRTGVRGWAEAIGGGAAIGAAIGSVVPVIGTAIGAAIGAAAGALAKGIQSLVNAIKGKNAYQAGAMELGRDFGGISMSADDFQKWLDSVGISESQAYPIRKDIESSSKFLAEVAGPLAEAQGKTQEFLKSLEAVKTSWGTFDFRKQYELGELTGDWTALDEAFKAAFKDSQALNQNVPDWQTKLTMLVDQAKKTAAEFQNLYKQFEETKTVSDEFADFLKKNADALDEAAKSSSAFADELAIARKALEIKPLLDGLKSLRDGISGMIPAVETMYDHFLKTGDIMDAFAAKITELGGDISKFTEVSGLVKLNSYFAEMVQHFRDTGEILPDLRSLFQQFGGDLSALDKAADLPGLKSSLGFIQDLSDELAKFLPEQTAIQKLMSGTMDQSVIEALTGAGIAPESLTKITGLLKMETGWDDAVKQFQQSGKLLQGGLLEQALLQYGGSAGQTAVTRYGQGFNTVTDQLLAGTKAAMDAAFRNERTGVLDILKKAAGDITKQVGDITKPIEDQFTVVSTNIQTAFQTAAAAAIAELDKILAKIEEIKTASEDIVTVPETPGNEEPVSPEPGSGEITPNMVEAQGTTGAYIDLRGATIFGYDEFARRVAEVQAQNARRAGIRAVA